MKLCVLVKNYSKLLLKIKKLSKYREFFHFSLNVKCTSSCHNLLFNFALYTQFRIYFIFSDFFIFISNSVNISKNVNLKKNAPLAEKVFLITPFSAEMIFFYCKPGFVKNSSFLLKNVLSETPRIFISILLFFYYT